MFEEIAFNLPYEICQEFRLALMRGHWGNGVQLTNKQRRICEQALFFRERNQPVTTH